LRAALLATPVAADWTLAARVAWWSDYHRQPVPGPDEVSTLPAPMATVSINLDSR